MTRYFQRIFFRMEKLTKNNTSCPTKNKRNQNWTCKFAMDLINSWFGLNVCKYWSMKHVARTFNFPAIPNLSLLTVYCN